MIEVALGDEPRRAGAAEHRRAFEQLAPLPDPDRRVEHQARLLLERHPAEEVVDPLLERAPRILVGVELPVAVEVADAPTVYLERDRVRRHASIIRAVLRRAGLDRQCYEMTTMDEHDLLSERFEEHRPHLRAVAYRLLGSAAEADDAVQESWLRLSRSDVSEVENLGGWLTTVVARVSLDMLRSRASRREELGDAYVPDSLVSPSDESDPEREAMLADSLGPALLTILDTLAPAERLAFVLHDMFAVPFEEIGAILGRSPNASKQLASRARRRLQGSTPASDADLARQREVVAAFLAASRGGDFEALLTVLDPEIVLRADRAAVQMGAPAEVLGAAAVAGVFSGRALEAQPALVGGRAGVVWAPGGAPKVAWDLTIAGGTIVLIEMIADAARLEELDLVVLGTTSRR